MNALDACMTALAIIFSVAACAGSSGRRTTSEDCGLRTQDSTFLARGVVYRECAVDRPTRMTTEGTRPNYQPSGRPSGCFSAEVEFVVDTAGFPEVETVRVVRTNEPGFAQAVLNVVPSWRYQPAVREGRKVRQIKMEKRMVAFRTVAVPAGSGPPRLPSSPPRC
jgi:Gram-negative bacterial TonB protein C-terminal